MGKWKYTSTVLDLGTKQRRVVSFKPRSLYPWGKSPRYPLGRRLGGPQRKYGRYGQEKSQYEQLVGILVDNELKGIRKQATVP
jgi:hypothetical protein